MMGRIFGQPFFLKAARLTAIGAIILRGFQADYEQSHPSTTVLAVVSVSRIARNRLCPWEQMELSAPLTSVIVVENACSTARLWFMS